MNEGKLVTLGLLSSFLDELKKIFAKKGEVFIVRKMTLSQYNSLSQEDKEDASVIYALTDISEENDL